MSSDGKKKDMKKKGHYVPSRYKQAADNISVQSNHSREKASVLKDSRDSRGHQISCNSSQDANSSSISQGSRGMTSTPTSKGKMPLPCLDESVVPEAGKFLSVPRLKERIEPLSSDCMKRTFEKKNKFHSETTQLHVPIIVSYKDKEKNDPQYNEKTMEAEMDLLFAEYLQMAFLESEAKKALVSRTDYAMETLQKLWSLVSQHMCKVQSQKFSLQLMSTVIKIHEHMQKQEDILKPVFEVIPNMVEKYKSLAEAVNVNKHKLHIEDVLLPEPGSEGELSDLLKELSDFITKFFEQVPNYKDVISTADVLKSYVDAAELMSKALKRGLDLLEETRDLSFSEASLALC